MDTSNALEVLILPLCECLTEMISILGVIKLLHMSVAGLTHLSAERPAFIEPRRLRRSRDPSVHLFR